MKKAQTNQTVLELPFSVEEIVPAVAPDGSNAEWHRYVISQGANTIVGMRLGSRAAVALQVDDMVARLNERRLGKMRR
jgi:hypothetical protein